jgi:hypothetical protein
MDNFFQNLGLTVAGFLPSLLAGIVILVVGWLVATLLSRLVANLLHRTTLDDRVAGMLQGGSPDRFPIERWISRAVFWIIMLFVIVAFLNTINLGGISGPLDDLLTRVMAFIPGLLGAAVLLLIAFVVATALRLIITRVISASGLSRRLTENADMNVDARGRSQIGQSIGNVVFWLVLLLFLPAVLDALQLDGVLAPVQTMVNDILGFLPNLLGAALIVVAGYLLARIIRQIVTNLLAGIGIDRLGAQVGVQPAAAVSDVESGVSGGGFRLSNVIGTVVFVLVLIPIVIAALNVLNIPAISTPAANMLTSFLNALPNIFAAVILLGIAFFVARIVGRFVAGLLANLGFDRLFTWLGVQPEASVARVSGTAASATAAVTGRTTPSQIVGGLVTVAIILFAAMEAANLLGFEALTTLISAFIVIAGNILFGLIIFALGMWLANAADRMIRNSDMQSAGLLATAARIAILIFAASLALGQMGIAGSIVNLAFGLLLGAVAVAVAIAFGLGGRDVAGRLLERWQDDIRNNPGGIIPATGAKREPRGPMPGAGLAGDSEIIPPTGSDFSDDPYGHRPGEVPPVEPDDDDPRPVM